MKMYRVVVLVLIVSAFVGFLIALIAHDSPAEPWVCSDVPCDHALQCPPTCSSCWDGRCQP